MRIKQGFTLVEILFVVIIAAGILAFAVPAYKKSQERAAYESATGILLDLGNAVQSFRMDLGKDFPQSSDKQIAGSEKEANATNLAGKTLAEYIGAVTGDTLDTKAVQALFSYNYLQPFSNSTYQFYAIKGNSSTVCSSRCRKPTGGAGSTAEVVACMCTSETTSTTSGCYYGAIYLSDGTLKRITADDSSCS